MGFHLVSLWSVHAPVEVVWDAIYHSERWTTWWNGLESVVELERGKGEGIGNRRRYIWRGFLPYRLVVVMTATRIEPSRRLEARAEGDVEGTGCWWFFAQDGRTCVRYDWRVRLVRPWMRRVSPLARSLFRWNHDVVMRRGAEGLAGHLRTRVTCQTA